MLISNYKFLASRPQRHRGFGYLKREFLQFHTEAYLYLGTHQQGNTEISHGSSPVLLAHQVLFERGARGHQNQEHFLVSWSLRIFCIHQKQQIKNMNLLFAKIRLENNHLILLLIFEKVSLEGCFLYRSYSVLSLFSSQA